MRAVIDTLHYLGCGRRELELACGPEPPRALLLGANPWVRRS